MENKKIYYWSPFFSKVATVDAVINSAISLKRYHKKTYDVSIINVFGEFKEYEEKLKENNVNLITLKDSKIVKSFSKPGFIRSRFLTIYVFFKYFFSLKNLLKKNQPNFLIIHLITILPLFLILLFKFQTKIIFRISGYPRLNFLRKLFWRLAFKKIYKVTSPTIETKNRMIKEKITEENKIVLLRDPIVSPKKINILVKEPKDEQFMNYYLSIGRLTRQKNYSFLIDCFHELIKKDDKIKLVIIGEGELKENLEKKIKKLKLNQNIFLIGYQKNVFKYLKNAKAFVLSSLWEDPGFVLIEAAFCNISIISSNCPNGPSELLNGGKDGFMYQSNNKLDFLSKFNEYLLEDKNQLLLKKIAVKKNSRDFTYFKHNIELSKIL